MPLSGALGMDSDIALPVSLLRLVKEGAGGVEQADYQRFREMSLLSCFGRAGRCDGGFRISTIIFWSSNMDKIW